MNRPNPTTYGMEVLATSIEAANRPQYGFDASGIIDPIIAIACALLGVWFIVKKVSARFVREKNVEKILGITSSALQNLRSLKKTYLTLAKAVSDRLEEHHLYPIIDTLRNEVAALTFKLLGIQRIRSANEILAFLKMTEKRLSVYRTSRNLGGLANDLIQDIDVLNEFEQTLLRIHSTEDPDFYEAADSIKRK